MFKAKVKAEVLKAVLDAVAHIVDEVKLTVTPEGVSLKAVDPAHVAMIELSLGKKAFEEYKATDMDLGIDLDKLKEILKLASSQDVIDLEYKEDSHRLVFKVGKILRRMSLVDTSSMAQPAMPNLSLPSQVRVPTRVLSQAVKAGEQVSDHLILMAHGPVFEINAEGTTDSTSVHLETPDVEVQAPDKSRSLFSLDYFSNMAKAFPEAGQVTIKLGSDYPVRMECDLFDGRGHITYLLAPRIESE